ncbi:MAG: hypothetical protein M3209_19595 [Acidobacteriota bacterium]|nr:hypothetical protein [Acidobacteriota bacterium]
MRTYNKSGDILPCKLAKDDLFKLVSLLSESFSDSESLPADKVWFNITSNLSDSSISAKNINDFLEQEGLPKVLNNLLFDIVEYGDSVKTIRLYFDPEFITLNVSYNDEIWVLGKYARIEKFLRDRQQKYWFLKPLLTYIAWGFLLFFIYPLYIFYKNGQNLYAASTILFMIIAGIFLILTYNNKIWSYTIIELEKSPINHQKIGTIIGIIGLVLAFLSLIVSVIGLFKGNS